MSTSRSRKTKTKKPRTTVNAGELIAEIGNLSRTKPASTTTLITILQRLQTSVGADALSLYQYDPVSQELSELVSVGKRVELVGFLAIGQGQGLTGWAALQSRPLVLKNRSTNLSFDPDRDFANFLATPLPLGAAPLGLLAIGCKTPGVLDEKESEFVAEVSDALASALERFLFCRKLDIATKEIDRCNRQLTDYAHQAAAGRELGNVASRMIALNHEVNEALSVIIGHLQCLVADRTMATQKELSRLRRMEEAALRIRTVNQTLLKLAKTGQSRQPVLNSR